MNDVAADDVVVGVDGGDVDGALLRPSSFFYFIFAALSRFFWFVALDHPRAMG